MNSSLVVNNRLLTMFSVRTWFMTDKYKEHNVSMILIIPVIQTIHI